MNLPTNNYYLPFTNYQLLKFPRNTRHLQLPDRLCDLDIARAGIGTVVNRVAARQSVRFADDLHPLGSTFIAAVEDETMSRHERRGTVVFVARPKRWAGSGTSRAQN